MMTLLAIIGKLVLDLMIGLIALRFSKRERTFGETVCLALLTGIYLETILEFVSLWAGSGLIFSVLLLTILTLALLSWLIVKKEIVFPRVSIPKPRWYEWVLGILIAEKFFFALWQLVATPTYFDDALTHWSGRSRALFGVVNWSFDPNSPVFLGFTGAKQYPLLTSVWRATTASLNGGWNEVISRADSLIFFLILIYLTWAGVYHLSKNRWLSAISAYTLSALPLLVWHAAAGWNDIAVAVFSLAALICVVRRDWLIGGFLAAAAAWSKNEGLVVYVPAMAVAVFILNLPTSAVHKISSWTRDNIRGILLFVLGWISLSPWIIFNFVHHLGFSAPGLAFNPHWHPDGPGLFWDKVIRGETHGIFWPIVFTTIFFMGRQLWRQRNGKAMLGVAGFIMACTFFIFFFLDSFEWLRNDMTIHRNMLQFAPIALFIATYGISLKLNQLDLLSAQVTQFKPKLIKKKKKLHR